MICGIAEQAGEPRPERSTDNPFRIIIDVQKNKITKP